MPVVRYFLFVGTALLALLFIVDACLPQLPVVESANTAANTATDLSVIRIHSDRKWPERVEFDTRLPIALPAPVRTAEASVPATATDGASPVRMRDAFAQLQTARSQTSEPKKLEPKLASKRKPVVSKTVMDRTVASRNVSKSRVGPPVILIAQQPHPGFFGNTIW
jgi:hypothetical protein